MKSMSIRESFAKALAKDGLHLKARWNSGFAKASLQEYSSLGVEVSEVADEGEQGPKYYVITIFSTLGSSLWSVRVFWFSAVCMCNRVLDHVLQE